MFYRQYIGHGCFFRNFQNCYPAEQLGMRCLWHTCSLACYTRYFIFQNFYAEPSQRRNRETVLYVRLDIPLVARYIRVYPLKWLVAPCMRVEFYGCEPGKSNFFLLFTWEFILHDINYHFLIALVCCKSKKNVFINLLNGRPPTVSI